MIIGLNGLIGSGKGAASDYLQQHYGFHHMSFADSLKQAVGAIFGWDYELLKGATSESRVWREVVDPWWAERLGIPNLSPRTMLQQWGTEVGRRSFHQDIWIASLEKKLIGYDGDIVIDDCRFTNEMEVIRKHNGSLVRINRGDKPEWYETAFEQLRHSYVNWKPGESPMEVKYPDVHVSEWGWVYEDFNYEIDNDGSLEELYQKLDLTVGTIRNS